MASACVTYFTLQSHGISLDVFVLMPTLLLCAAAGT
jgi:hypothetical protein